MLPLKINHILVDIDDTITHLKDNPYQNVAGIGSDYFRGVLKDMLVKKFGFNPSFALATIQEKDPIFNGCIFHTAPTLGISEEELWEEVITWQKNHLFVYADAVDMVKILFSKGFCLYVVTNNSCKGALAKLSLADLADRNNSSYFKKIYGMDLFGLGWSKMWQ